MGLITKEVEINLRGNNINYYENLGYRIPKYKDDHYRWKVKNGTKIIVKVEDLPYGSTTMVKIKCDECNKTKNITWANYKKHVHNEGKYYCNRCSINLSIRNKKDNLQEFIQQYLSLLNTYMNSFAHYLINLYGDNALEKYWDYEKNKNTDPWQISYGNKKQVYIKCQEKDYHGSYPVKCDNFIKGNRCPYCSNRHGKVHPLDSLGTLYPEVLEIWSDKNKKSPYEYSPNSTKEILWGCSAKKHENYYRSIRKSLACDFRCPECVQERDESFLQEKVRLYLESLKCIILHEYDCNLKCINPKTGRCLPYDNEVEKLKLVIEVHGSQHYYLNEWHRKIAIRNNTTPEYEFHYQKLKDRYKRIYAKLHGYFYLEIPYTADDKKETWRELIDEKVKNIIREM
jgi:galactitol-specific phosphotransferase system IIB component